LTQGHVKSFSRIGWPDVLY